MKKKLTIQKYCRTNYIKTRETYCGSCKKNTASKNSSVRRTKENTLMLVSNCAICGKKNQGSSKIKKLPDYYGNSGSELH